MSQEPHPSPDETREGEPGERVTLSIPVHLATPTRRTVVREGAKPARPAGRIVRIAHLLAQAHHFQDLLDTGVVRTQMELAALTRLTTARITQIMNLLVLAPDIQEEILFLPPVAAGGGAGDRTRPAPGAQDAGMARAARAVGQIASTDGRGRGCFTGR